MPDIEARMELMLFNYQTTYRTDYRRGEVTPPTFTLYKEKPTCVRIRPPPLKNLHTLSAWKEKPAPFSLMHTPKPIIGTDPTKVQEPYVKQPDMDGEHVRKTRPRLVMPPAVSMDDIADPLSRKVLCESMYTSSMTRGTRDAVLGTYYFMVKAPSPGLPAPSNPIRLPPLRLPYVSPEWRMETVSWDRKQLRGYCDPTKEFWLSQKLPPCRPCRETEIVEANRKLHCQVKAEQRA